MLSYYWCGLFFIWKSKIIYFQIYYAFYLLFIIKETSNFLPLFWFYFNFTIKFSGKAAILLPKSQLNNFDQLNYNQKTLTFFRATIHRIWYQNCESEWVFPLCNVSICMKLHIALIMQAMCVEALQKSSFCQVAYGFFIKCARNLKSNTQRSRSGICLWKTREIVGKFWCFQWKIW